VVIRGIGYYPIIVRVCPQICQWHRPCSRDPRKVHMPGLTIAVEGLEHNPVMPLDLTPVLAQRGVKRLGQNKFLRYATRIHERIVSLHYCFGSDVRRPAGQQPELTVCTFAIAPY